MAPDTLRTIFELIAMVIGAGAAIWRIGRWIGLTLAKLTYLTDTVEDGFEQLNYQVDMAIKEIQRQEGRLIKLEEARIQLERARLQS